MKDSEIVSPISVLNGALNAEFDFEPPPALLEPLFEIFEGVGLFWFFLDFVVASARLTDDDCFSGLSITSRFVGGDSCWKSLSISC